MRSLFLLCVALLACASHAFAFAPRSVLTSRMVRNPVSKMMAVKPAASGIPEGYWEGDWVCADCGYVFDKDIDGGGKYFEDHKKGFICPQCSAPRRRYAKKVGDKWGVTNDGGDFPIYALTAAGMFTCVCGARCYPITLVPYTPYYHIHPITIYTLSYTLYVTHMHSRASVVCSVHCQYSL